MYLFIIENSRKVIMLGFICGVNVILFVMIRQFACVQRDHSTNFL